ncbi:MAG TPA: cytochrome c biogenesis protein ResB, partial [Myxococcota bacterium]|nr:cytochrome c biogenesis protein ResB [Myxococcota bacterium]
MKAIKRNSLIDRIWQVFVSLKLTFVLLLFIAIGAVIGMSYDQTITYEEFYQKHSSENWGTSLLSFFELHDAFHSWWFSLAILLL